MRKKSKKMAANISALAEEHKSDEMKALEACLTAWKGATHLVSRVCTSVQLCVWVVFPPPAPPPFCS